MNNFIEEKIRNEARYYEIMTSAYIPVNHWAIRVLSIEAAVIFAALFDEYSYHKRTGFY